MLESILSFFRRNTSADPAGGSRPGAPSDPGHAEERARLQVAAAALLLELVHADEEFSDEERAHLEASLARHFDLNARAVAELIERAEAERSSAVDLYQFTRVIRSSYDLAQKTVLAEVMWGLILADGHIADREAHLVRKIGKLLDLKPGFLAEARRRAGSPPEVEPGE